MGERAKTKMFMDRIKRRMVDLRIKLDIETDDAVIEDILVELYELDIEYGECEGYLIELDQIDGEYVC